MEEIIQKKKKEEEEGAAAGGGDGRWEVVSPEVLALIFVRVSPADEMARTVPFVCRAWREAVVGPYCWSHIDIEPWCRRVGRTDAVDGVVRRLSRRSRGCLRSLTAFLLGYNGFFYACSASSEKLRVLRMPMSAIADDMLAKHVTSLSMLTELDISNCLNVTSKGIETLGKHCKALVHLKRNMPPPQDVTWQDNGAAAKFDDSEVVAIADTMPGLKHLELAYGRFRDSGLHTILNKCKELSVLDIRGCWNVRLEGDIEEKCLLIQYFRDPWENDFELYEDDDGEEEEEEEEDIPQSPPSPGPAPAEEDDSDWDWDDEADGAIEAIPAQVMDVSDDDIVEVIQLSDED